MKKQVHILLVALICVLVSPPGLLAAEEQVPQQSAAVNIIYAILPLCIIGGILWLFLRKSQRSPIMLRSIEHYERAEEHMGKMEQIGERIAAALETKNKDGA